MSKEVINRWWRTYNGWLFVANLVFALINLIIVIICLKPCYSNGCCIGSSEVVVGIYSLLVTILIGWNIFTVIDFKARTEEFDERYSQLAQTIDEKTKKCTEEIEKQKSGLSLLNERCASLAKDYVENIGQIEASFVELSLSLYQNKKPEERLPIIVFHGLKAAGWSAIGNNIDNANGLLYILYRVLVEVDNFSVDKGLLDGMILEISRLERFEEVAKTDVFKYVKKIIMGCSDNNKEQQ